MKKYSPRDIEPKWQEIWQETNVYTTDFSSKKPKYVGMSMFNYPSGAGIHVGHAMNYTISDVKARFKRQQGYESYHPVGWDAFGLPAENYAIKAGVSPQESMAKIIPSYHKQYQAMGWSNDWEKEISTCVPEYYKWTQWIFSKMYEHGLAYQDARMQWWCNKCQTVLANEQVTADNKCWRHEGKDDPIIQKKQIKQWFFKITEYADELLQATDDLDWTESVKLAQKNWIGRSEGAEIDFAVDSKNTKITVFTTRADTLFGATFLVLAPEHELVNSITTKDQQKVVEDYVKQSAKKTELERQAGQDKTGVFTGAYVINPINNQKIPIWIADYVLSGYGTGAIMAVPAHDQRDYEFAQKYNLTINQVIMPCDTDATNPPQKGLKMVERQMIVVHFFDKSTNKYALLDWHNSLEGTCTAIMGGIENGQTAKQAVHAEISEEAGLNNVKIVKELRWLSGAKYCASHKNENRKSITKVFLAEVENIKNQAKISDKEINTHTLKWVDKNKVEQSLTTYHQKLVWQQLQNETALEAKGNLINSGIYDGLESSEATLKIVKGLQDKGLAKKVVNYKMRDWSVSRQRYWGAPIPIIHCQKCGIVPVPEQDLPVILPELTDFQPSGDGRSALARAKDWLVVDCPKCGGKAERETDTLDTYICSSWYMLRYLDPHNQAKIFDSKIANKWMPIDFYNGGDHATAHLLYARFVTRFFYKLGLVNNPEPFKQMLFNGKVVAKDGKIFSKTLGNGPDPLQIINSGYGADALRVYLMFAAPLELGARWDEQGVPGAYRYLNRLWTLTQEYLESKTLDDLPADAVKKLKYSTNNLIKKATQDLENNKYNTAIAFCMAQVNELYKYKVRLPFGKNPVWQSALEANIVCIAPFAPHIADELWQQLGHSTSVHKDSWPKLDTTTLSQDTVTIVVQVNGKLRGTIAMPADSTQKDVEAKAKAHKNVASYITGDAKKIIYIKDKLLNMVV